MELKFFEKLSNNYLELLDDKEDFNVVINIGESPNTKIFRAHSAILRYRSLYFSNELKNIIKDKNNIKTINLKNVSVQQFEIIIKYIYGGTVSLEKHDASFIFELMLIADELLFEELAKNLQTHLIEVESHWLRLQFSRVYQKSFQNNNLQELQEWCNNIVVKYPNKIFDSEDFTSLQENALVSLISRDDLQMEEVKVWDYIIKWGIAQNPGLPSDPEDWSNENFMALKTTLHKCLPHIRYFQMSGNDIVNNVQPYQQVLEKNLWKDVMKKYMANQPITSNVLPPRTTLTSTLPPRDVESFSTVINEAHAAEIASWIDRKDDTYLVEDNPYNFELLLRGSRDGFTVDSFWKLCEKQTHLVVVMKVKDTDEILGGYNPIGWDRQYYCQNCKDCFIFSLKNDNIQNSILSRVKEHEKAIYSINKYGPIFGPGFDLAMSENFNLDKKCWTSQIFSHKKLIRNADKYNPNKYNPAYKDSFFSVEEYEIFQIKKKS